MRRIALLAVIAAVAVVALVAFGASAGSAARVATLSGAEEVPGPGDPDGSGRAKVKLNADTGMVCFNIRWENIGAPTMAHIHTGAKGVAGDPVVTLFAGTAPLPDTISKVGGCVSGVDAALIQDIKKNSKSYYVNVHTEEFPGGAIRGQLKKV
jgi:hypothetical protein